LSSGAGAPAYSDMLARNRPVNEVKVEVVCLQVGQGLLHLASASKPYVGPRQWRACADACGMIRVERPHLLPHSLGPGKNGIGPALGDLKCPGQHTVNKAAEGVGGGGTDALGDEVPNKTRCGRRLWL
jgi:hypothetical protein